MRILDLYCGVGGSSVGIHQAFPQAGIVGIDIRPQPRYPYQFIQGNALDYPTNGFDFIWASPPCQHYTGLLKQSDQNKHPDLIQATRQKLISSRLPYVIENVVNAPVRRDLVLCGEMFGLRVIRHRVFELNFKCIQPVHILHRGITMRYRGDSQYYLPVYGNCVGKAIWALAMDMNTSEFIHGLPTHKELSQAVPPAYSRYILSNFKSPSSKKHYYIHPRTVVFPSKSKEKTFFKSVKEAELKRLVIATDLNIPGPIFQTKPLFKKKRISKKQLLREIRQRVWGEEYSLIYKSDLNR